LLYKAKDSGRDKVVYEWVLQKRATSDKKSK
jgi:hypothetical protein